jgi:hypothetical protein
MKSILASMLLFFASSAFAQQQPALLNYGWSSGVQWNSPAEFYKDAEGVVHLSGLIYRWGDPSIASAVFLPVGYRPAKDYWFPIVVNGVQMGTAVARPLGDVVILMNQDSAWASLSGVNFPAQ